VGALKVVVQHLTVHQEALDTVNRDAFDVVRKGTDYARYHRPGSPSILNVLSVRAGEVLLGDDLLVFDSAHGPWPFPADCSDKGQGLRQTPIPRDKHGLAFGGTPLARTLWA